MFFNRIGLLAVSLTLACALTTRAQQSQTDEYSPVRDEASPGVWHLMRYAGVLQQEAGLPRPTVAGVTFALYGEKEGGIPLWMETQNVQVDSQGHYSALLGETKTGGVPAELFASGKTRWLGIQVAGQFAEERVPLGSVPYAVQAGDAQTLGGKSAVDYALTAQIQQQVQEEVRRELQAAGFAVSGDDPAGAGYQKQVRPEDSGPPPDPGTPPSNVITHETLVAKLDMVLAKLDTIDATLNQPERVFSFVLCTEPIIKNATNGVLEFNLDLDGQGRLGVEAFGNGLLTHANVQVAGKVGNETAVEWNILKLGVCVDLGAAVRNASPTTSSGGATPLRQASLTANDGIAAANGGGLLDHIANLNQDAMLAQMLGLADSLGIDPANLQNAMGTVASLSFDTSGGPFTALQLKEADRAALMATLPIPVGMKPVLTDPGGFFRSQVQSLLPQLTQPNGICNISPPPGLELFLDLICNQPAEPFGPLLTGLKTTTDAINTSVNTVKSNVNTVKTGMESLVDDFITELCKKILCG